jgi:hypothetical protein
MRAMRVCQYITGGDEMSEPKPKLPPQDPQPRDPYPDPPGPDPDEPDPDVIDPMQDPIMEF